MLSFPKLVVLVAVVAIIWFGFRWFERWERERRQAAERTQSRLGGRPAATDGGAEDMKACAVCGTFVAATARACGRANCPLPHG
ncbi:MAG: hypothetical protein JO128_17330 [Alphaproteobacteria bacterium]|nr:hypothetical protein [Alphaproteobacteria bacterium]